MYLKIAHRGASGYEPENTIRAFEKAIELGADMIELDVHLSRDGRLIVMHDASVGKTTDGSGYIRGLTLQELKTFDAGKGEQIPTLQEAIGCAKGRCGLYIELKGEYTEKPVVELIRENAMQNAVIIASFDRNKVRKVKGLAPELETSVLVGDKDADWVAIAKDAKADCIHFCWERYPSPHKLLTDEVMSKASANGLKVIIWHEERPEEIREIIKRDIYGVCSNLPDLLYQLNQYFS
ncbi:MAG: glycerophosphodiester phosphodiesterase [Candidatus Poribacteria bacterium]